MTSSNALSYVPHLQALADGELQFNAGTSNAPDWIVSENPNFSRPPEFYRRSPSPVMIPLDASDFAARPVTWIRGQNTQISPLYMVHRIGDFGVEFGAYQKSFEQLRTEGWLWCDRPSQRPEDWKQCEKEAT